MCMGRHFFLLAQRQMYDNQIDAAMKTAIRCKDFEDVLDPVDLHSLIALIACHNKFFNICSQAPACLHACTPARLHACTPARAPMYATDGRRSSSWSRRRTVCRLTSARHMPTSLCRSSPSTAAHTHDGRRWLQLGPWQTEFSPLAADNL